MKHITNYIHETFKVGSKTKISKYTYHPKYKDELINLIDKLIRERGNEADLNDIDTSEITDMSYLFSMYNNKGLEKFNGDISNWDVSNVEDMHSMFLNSNFDGDLSKWDVSKVTDMEFMFCNSKYTGKNGDISNWNINNVKNMHSMFFLSYFDIDISNWDIHNVKNTRHMFSGTPLEDKKKLPNWYQYKK